MAQIEVQNHKLYLEDIRTVLTLNCDWNKLKNKTILITGATGLLGSVFVDMLKLLSKEYSLNLKLLLISRHNKESLENNIFYIKHDINCPFEYSERIDFIVHLASNTHPKLYATAPIETITTNIFGTYYLLQLAAKNEGCRFVNISSVEIYGENKNIEKIPFSEKDMGYLDCNTARAGYCEAKRTSECLCQSFKSQYNVDFVTARLCRCYGPTLKTDDTKALSQFIRNGINKKNIVLKSEGVQYYSYLYSSDAVLALIFLMLNGISGEEYNIADKKSDLYLKDLAKIIAEISGTEVIFDLPSETEKRGYSTATTAILNAEKLNKLGWKPCYNIQQGIKRTLEMLQE